LALAHKPVREKPGWRPARNSINSNQVIKKA
jgi:hypothetical protein